MEEETKIGDKGKIFHWPQHQYFQESEKESVEFAHLKTEYEIPVTFKTRK